LSVEQHLGEVGMMGGPIRPERNGPARQLPGAGDGTARVMHDAEPVQHVGVTGIAVQEGLVAAGRVGVATGLMQLVSGFHVHRSSTCGGQSIVVSDVGADSNFPVP
jgi:hypothetical protein